MVIKAVGQQRMQESVQKIFPEVAFSRSGEIVRDFSTGATSTAKVFAGGDAANGGSEVVDAVAEGKRAAYAIHRDLTGETGDRSVQKSRVGTPGQPVGAGIDGPVRVPALEAQYAQQQRQSEGGA